MSLLLSRDMFDLRSQMHRLFDELIVLGGKMLGMNPSKLRFKTPF